MQSPLWMPDQAWKILVPVFLEDPSSLISCAMVGRKQPALCQVNVTILYIPHGFARTPDAINLVKPVYENVSSDLSLEAGLKSAIRWFAEGFCRCSRIKVHSEIAANMKRFFERQ
jgi:hypothetical protein